MSTAVTATESDAAEPRVCWCCGGTYPEPGLVRLGSHPEVGICLPCAHYLHQQARGREDARRRSPAARLRDGLRAGLRLVHAAALA
ncbi:MULTISPECIES: hypothetical protein [Protofrankia]|uniref:Uncharacterized protein n=1 Tax=Candidatus Protofrankia datiscae TaxID=2716812 RepID=F8B2B9_9ACTN|nr:MULTISPECIES: hypothetical protein [Protofrankia]AEH10796.1 hypothetical protein FsymDg_3513 [Candidatus Protofrankia datiscae]